MESFRPTPSQSLALSEEFEATAGPAVSTIDLESNGALADDESVAELELPEAAAAGPGRVDTLNMGDTKDTSDIVITKPPKRDTYKRQLSGSLARGGRPLSIVIETPAELATAAMCPTSASPLSEGTPAQGTTRSPAAEDEDDDVNAVAHAICQLGEIDTETACRLLQEIEIAACLFESEPAEVDYGPWTDDESDWSYEEETSTCTTERGPIEANTVLLRSMRNNDPFDSSEDNMSGDYGQHSQ